MKIILFLTLFISTLFAHPVAYSINLTLKYDTINKTAYVICSSDSRNKCGLYSFDLLEENNKIITTKKFPFLKKSIQISSKKKPFKMKFFLRKIPEHYYTAYLEN